MRTVVVALACLAACGGTEPAPTPAASAPAPAASAPATPAGDPAPDFTLPDLDGKPHTLSALRGKTVVLEWFNPGCPFIKYAHGEGPLATLAAQLGGQGVVYLAINSSAPGKQGHGVDANRAAAAAWHIEHPILLDPDGAVGKAYGATSTPHMFVIDPTGAIAYRGALDDAPLGKPPTDGGKAYVSLAVAALAGGTAPDPARTQPYGCSVKYAD
jgi:thiol-disulfide isomerase/thioredoxin